jgi:hypothetical protein
MPESGDEDGSRLSSGQWREKSGIESVALSGQSGMAYSLVSAPELWSALLSVSSLFDELSLRRFRSYDAVSFKAGGIPRAFFQTFPVSSWCNHLRRFSLSTPSARGIHRFWPSLSTASVVSAKQGSFSLVTLVTDWFMLVACLSSDMLTT